MQKSILVGVLVASLGLSACGVSASIKQSVASLGASSDVQVHLTAHFTGAGSAKAASILKQMSLDIRLTNPSGAPLSQSSEPADVEFIVNVAGTSLVDIRSVGGNAYVNLDLSSLSSIPGVNVTAAQLATAQLVVGGRWFELPKSLISTLVPTKAANAAKAAQDQAIGRTVLDEIAKVIDSSKYTTLAGGGYTETGTLQSIVNAIAPTILSLTHASTGPGKVKGDYTVTLTNSGSTATGGSISITAPNGSKGNATGTLTATVTHDSTPIVAPKGVTVITPALIKQLTGRSL